MHETRDDELDQLRDRIDRALERNDASSAALARELLDQLVTKVAPDSPDALFAHRKLAELLLEREPWVAALHVRKALVQGASDDGLHAMMGLCQALLGNYRAAVAAYGRASRIAPSVGWYHHNLGHLLDVALDDPAGAEVHLRAAHRLASHHDEVVSSLAHCIARLGMREEALALAQKARTLKPNKPAHRELEAWIESGACERLSTAHSRPEVEAGGTRRREVADAVSAQMRRYGYADPVVEGAQRLWDDFSRGRTLRIVKTAVYAAAVEYAMASLSAWPGATQAAVAKRYGVAAASVGTRFAEIREALRLVPFDPRYVSKT